MSEKKAGLNSIGPTNVDHARVTGLAAQFRESAIELGFAECRFCHAIESSGFHGLVDWVESGYAGEMSYFSDRLEAYRHPASVLTGVKTIAALVWPYDWREQSANNQKSVGRTARYTSMGSDYHDVIHAQLKRLCRSVESVCPHVNCRGVVDTAPINEREVAELAGIGWRGKNTLLLSKTRGSYFFLACVLIDVELEPSDYDQPHTNSHCGTCTACLTACPTNAFVDAGVLDARRCISYLTIEHRGMPPMDLRSDIGDWIFGCDVCQEVCPWNRKMIKTVDPIDAPEPKTQMDLKELFLLDDEAFRKRFRKTPMWRVRRRGLLRNAAVVLGNQRDATAVPTLVAALNDSEPLIRAACVWALNQIRDPSGLVAIESLRTIESDAVVWRELNASIQVEG